LVVLSNRILKGWTNVALASSQGRAIKLAGQASGKVKDGSSFNPSSSFALEAWVSPKLNNARQIIMQKPGSYCLYINTLGKVVLEVTLSQAGATYDAPPVVFTHTLSAAIPAGQTSYVEVNFTTGSVPNGEGTDQFATQYYYIYSSLFINGAKAADANKR